MWSKIPPIAIVVIVMSAMPAQSVSSHSAPSVSNTGSAVLGGNFGAPPNPP
jgi:hypothetical protein